VPSLQRLFHRCSSEDIYLRFFRYLRSLTVEEAVRLCTGSQGLDVVFVAVVGERESERLVASACLFGEVTTQLAEVGYLVDPEWQGGGLGRELQTLLIAKGCRSGTDTSMHGPLSKQHDVFRDLDGTFVGTG